MSKHFMPLILGAALALTPALRAGQAEAEAAFQNGQSLERERDYRDAVAAYQKALDEEPQYTVARRQMGTCYYMMGDRAQALRCFRAYLATNPGDARTRAFADSIERESPQALPAAEPRPTARPRQAPARVETTRVIDDAERVFAFDLNLGYGGYAMGPVDYWGIKALDGGGLLGLNLRCKPVPMLEVDLGFNYSAAACSEDVTYDRWVSHYGHCTVRDGYTWDFGLADFSTGAALVQRVGPVALKAGLNGGYAWLSGAKLQLKRELASHDYGDGYTETVDYPLSGGAFTWQAYGGMDWYFTERFSLGFDMGYRQCRISEVRCDKALDPSGHLTTPGGGNVTLDYSGVYGKLGFNFWI